MSNKRGFIAQTARDYDMDEYIVETYYYRYFNEGTFYEKLEEYVRERARE